MFSKYRLKKKVDAIKADVTTVIQVHRTLAKSRVQQFIDEELSVTQRDRLISTLNGILGDNLQDSESPYCRNMVFRDQKTTLNLNQDLSEQLNCISDRIILCVHGWCMSDIQWTREGHDHGQAFVQYGYTPIYVRYNTGRHISLNGELLNVLLTDLMAHWPCELKEIAIIAHSMGGLVVRSALYYGEQQSVSWLPLVCSFITLGTPHNGAPLAQVGGWLDSRIAIHRQLRWLSRLTEFRGAGSKDLSQGLICHQDWQQDNKGQVTRPMLPASISCYAIACCLGKSQRDRSNAKLGDGLVPISSALGQGELGVLPLNYPYDHCWVRYGINHVALLSDKQVMQRLKMWVLENTH